MKFRKAELGDYEDLVDLITRSVLSIKDPVYPKETYPMWAASYTKEATLKGKISDPHSYFILLIEDEQIIGEGILTGNEIHGVYADHDVQKSGIGTNVMDHLEESAREKGITEIVINSCLPDNGF